MAVLMAVLISIVGIPQVMVAPNIRNIEGELHTHTHRKRERERDRESIG